MTRSLMGLLLPLTLWAGAPGCPSSPLDADGDGWSVDAGDCDDADPSVHPLADERCDAAGRDEDCDGLEGAQDPSTVDLTIRYADEDADGYGDPFSPVVSCAPGAPGVTNALDCDDDEANVSFPDGGCGAAGYVVLGPDGGDGEGSGYASLQAALDAAPPGGAVYLAAGIYHVNLSFPRRAISLIATVPGQVVLDGSGCVDGEGRCSVVRILWADDGGPLAAARARLEGLVLTGGLGSSGAEVGDSLGRTYGGGIAVASANPILDGLTVRGNRADRGGGLWLDDASARLTDVQLSDNDAETGGGAYVGFSDLDAQGLSALGNRASSGGGLALDNSGGALGLIDVRGNRADYGAGLNLTLSSPRISEAAISGNDAADLGGGLYLYDSPASFDGLTLLGNTAKSGAGFNSSTTSPVIDGIVARRNKAEEYGGAFYLYEGSPVIARGEITDNEADVGGGLFVTYSHPRISNLWLGGNDAAGSGGGLYAASSRARLTNVVVTDNTSANKGGGIYESYSDLTLTNVTVVANHAPDGGGIFMHFNSAPVLESSLVALNTADAAGPNLFVHESSAPTLSYDLFWDGAGAGIEGGAPGPTGLTADPRFVDGPADGDVSDDDYHLGPASPAKDAGSPSPTQGDPDGSRNDMGAYGGPGAASW